MAAYHTLETLIDLATNETDEAARQLGRAIRMCNDTEQKLALLLQYREEYQARFQAGLATGISTAAYRNFQFFLDKLDAAVEGQEKIVQDAKRNTQDARNAWQSSERKRISYDTLATRAQQEQQRKENKRDQKMMDEFATRAANYKR